MKSIGIICRHNAARSPLLEAFLQNIYPEYHFFSVGTEAKEGKALPKMSNEVSRLLGLLTLKECSEKIVPHDNRLLEADLIICADKKISEIVQKSYPNQNIISVTEFAKSKGIRLIDPANCPPDEFTYQIAKFLFCGVSTFRGLVEESKQNSICAIISKNENIEKETRKIFESFATISSTPIYISTNLKYADDGALLNLVPSENWLKIDYRKLVDQDVDDFPEVAMLSPSHEMATWEKFVVSIEWRKFLKTLSLKRPVILLCTPIDIVPERKHESFLEALTADKIIYRS